MADKITKQTNCWRFDMTRTIPNNIALLVDKIKQHQVIVANPYTHWFAEGEATIQNLEDLLVQFSVFSLHFLPAQCKRMVNARKLGKKAMKEARLILVTENGVRADGTWHDESAHINWLEETAELFNLKPPKIPYELGDWDLGWGTTHRFLEELEAVYGSRDVSIAAGASFAIESWAGFGLLKLETEYLNFWKQLIEGLVIFNSRGYFPEPVSPAFFEWHVGDEKEHAKSVERELLETFDLPQFNIEKWKEGAFRALDAILLFWVGLDEQRKTAP